MEMTLQEPESKLLHAVAWVCAGLDPTPINKLLGKPFDHDAARDAFLYLDTVAQRFENDLNQVAHNIFSLCLDSNMNANSPTCRGLLSYMANLQAVATMLRSTCTVLDGFMFELRQTPDGQPPLRPMIAGPLADSPDVTEPVTCNHCGAGWTAKHALCESLECPSCGKRVSPPSANTEAPDEQID